MDQEQSTSTPSSSVMPELPFASICRVIKASLPERIQMSKEARHTYSKATSVFILYLTSTAQDIAREHKRTTIQAEDVLQALEEVDFEEFVHPLQEFLGAFRSEQEVKKSKKAAAQQEKEKEEGEDNERDEEEEGIDEDVVMDEEEEEEDEDIQQDMDTEEQS